MAFWMVCSNKIYEHTRSYSTSVLRARYKIMEPNYVFINDPLKKKNKENTFASKIENTFLISWNSGKNQKNIFRSKSSWKMQNCSYFFLGVTLKKLLKG